VPLTPAHMAYYARVPVLEAEKHLEKMVESAILIKECDVETGAVSYVFPKRSLLAPRPAPLAPRGAASPALAAALSVILPGAGHFYSGRERAGLFWMCGTFLGYLCLILPGVILHLLCIVSAARGPHAHDPLERSADSTRRTVHVPSPGATMTSP